VASPTHRFTLRSEGGGPELVVLTPGDATTIGRDARNRAQIGHASIEPFHARLRCDDWGVWIEALPGAVVSVAGEAAQGERVIPLGARVELGALRFELVEALRSASSPSWARRMRRALSMAAGMTISLLLHSIALWLLLKFGIDAVKEVAPLSLRSDLVVAPESEMATLPPPEPIEPRLEPEEVVDVEPLAELPAPDPAPAESSSLGNDLDMLSGPIRVGVGPGAGGGAGLTGNGRLSLDDDGRLSRGFVSRLRALRGSGVDLVFVIDATSSMRPFLEGARTAADRLVSALATIVEDLRVGVVAYRDRGDEFSTRVLPLGGDRYAILNFLWGLRAEGGGDVPEAVVDGLAAAIQEIHWRPRTHHVIVVVGDAPPHVADWPRLKSLVASFARREMIPGAVVSAIYTGPPRATVANPEEDGAAALAEIARLGRGDYLDFDSGANVEERLLVLTLGPKHATELQTLLSRVRDGPREQLIRKRVGEGDKSWLLARLRQPPLHPAVVNALIDLSDRTILWEARKVVADADLPRECREAALYILRRSLPQAIDFDLDREPDSQRGVLNRLDALILRR